MEKVKNREWVKTATIIFLAVLLVLTFFSNTIMNRTLPEVASQEVESGSITAKVRGTGKVSAVSNTEVKATATRYLAEINVKEGQEIEAGDLLFTMGAGDSEELEAAEDNLDTLTYSLMRTNNSYPADTTSATLESANADYADAVAEYDLALADLSKMSAYKDDPTYISLSTELANAEYDLASSQTTLETTQAKAESELTAAQEYYDYCLDLYNGCLDSTKSEEYSEKLEEAYKALNEKQAAYDKTFTTDCPEYNAVIANQQKVDALTNEISQLTPDLTAAQARVDAAVTARTTAQTALNSAQSAANAAYATNAQTAAGVSIDAAETQNKIEKAEAKVAELSGEDPQEIVAPVSGTVTSISVNSGSKVSKDQVLCIIESDDKGYTMSFSITNDQAKRIKVGDTATISNYYWGSDITATVSSIQVDQTDPQSKKKVTVDLEGDVTSGAELTVSIGQKSSTYDLTVPNSAVRSDSNGSFVLVLQAKNSALGNRYYAKRVAVEVLASDDVNSAISGDLSTGDFVITTSSSPITSGDQVRMADTAQ